MATTSTQQTVERARATYAAFSRGDLDHVMSEMADDIVWNVAGTSQLSGTRRGKQEVIEFMGRLMELTGGTFKIELHDVLASDDHGVVLARESAEREGRRYEGNVVHVTHYDSDGRIAEFWAIPEDQAAASAFYG